ncbi:MAG: hypothetical protein MUF77_00865 [Leptospira sp.]|nr:hypothetical protein [Leptospira sp.]
MNSYRFYFLFLSIWIVLNNFGESSFLGDQVDQIQSADAFWSGRLISFYGPYLSTTNPIVYPFGPVTYLIISVFKILQLTIPYYQFGYGILNIIVALLLLNELKKIDEFSGKIFCLLIPFSSVYIFSLSMFWNNVLIFTFSSLLCLFLLKFYRNPRGLTIVWIFLFFILGLHLHLIGIILFPIILSLILFRKKDLNSNLTVPPIRNRILVWLLVLFSMLPYLIAELFRKFKNTKNLFINSKSRLGDSLDISNLKSLVLDFLIPLDLSYPVKTYFSILILLLAFFVLILGTKASFGNRDNFFPNLKSKIPVFHFLIFVSFFAGISLLSELIFFTLSNQPIRSIHYQAYLTSISLVWISVFLSFLIQKAKILFLVLKWDQSKLSHHLKSIFRNQILKYLFLILLILYYTQSYENKYKSVWNFNAIVTSLDDICTERISVSSFEMEAFRSPHSEFKPVLQYLIEENLTSCTFDTHSKYVLVPYTFGNSKELLSRYPIETDLQFIQEYPPGIGLYFRKD